MSHLKTLLLTLSGYGTQGLGPQFNEELLAMLRKDLEPAAGMCHVQIGKQHVPVHPDFHLYILTKIGRAQADYVSFSHEHCAAATGAEDCFLLLLKGLLFAWLC